MMVLTNMAVGTNEAVIAGLQGTAAYSSKIK
jgi:hypothetical protein